ncbi:unnamed protein product [Vitrella brassicaformis CCMP3155]|uniref:RING-type domain-containing protein n=2 Tax=Vitrella brassicaformis TaxID=1169539 RepID=A0A0G4FUL5_VITBC|nr:unnamed protein product [Vitrella brassicaformis CCMP3155]|eukprot:CEM18634.1 unnamed protein product [Vitrella brassicaformis CCMP3155]
MQKLRRLNFFERIVVKTEGSPDAQQPPQQQPPAAAAAADAQPSPVAAPREAVPLSVSGLPQLHVVCVAGGPDQIWLGDAHGCLHRLDRQYRLVSFCAFEMALYGLKQLQMTTEGGRTQSLLIALGRDEGPRGSGPGGLTKYKVYDLSPGTEDEEGFPKCLREARLFSAKMPEQNITCFDANRPFTQLAIGTESAGVCLFRGDLIKERTCRLRLLRDVVSPVTGVHFLKADAISTKTEQRYYLFVCTTTSIASYLCSDKGDPQVMYLDPTAGAPSFCSTVVEATQVLLVLRDVGIFSYDAEQGNLSALPFEGQKMQLTSYKAYFAALTAEESARPGASPMSVTVGGPDGSSTAVAAAAGAAASQRQLVTVCLSYPEVRFVAFVGYINDVTHIFPAMGSLFVLARGGGGVGGEGPCMLLELREKDIAERLDILVKKRLFEWATEVALREHQPREVLQEVHRLHGDWLYDKRAFDQAIQVYTKTIGCVEPSYVIEKYLDAQRIHNLATYLKKLHEAGVAEKEHTTLLFKCYTKLKDTEALERFLKGARGKEAAGAAKGEAAAAANGTAVAADGGVGYGYGYDLSAAITECRLSGYSQLGADLALQQGQHDSYVAILMEDFRDFDKAIQHIQTLQPQMACTLLLKFGRPLIRHVPEETLALIKDICRKYNPSVEVFFPLFMDNSTQLRRFLCEVLESVGSSTDPANAVAAGRLASGAAPLSPAVITTALELLLREHKALVQKTSPDTATTTPTAAAAAATDATSAAPPTPTPSPSQPPSLSLSLSEPASPKSVIKLLREFGTSDETLQASLPLCQIYDHQEALTYVCEKLGLLQLPLPHFLQLPDSCLSQLVEYCVRWGATDQSLWTETLAHLATRDDANMAIMEVLQHIEHHRLLPPLAVLEILRQNAQPHSDSDEGGQEGEGGDGTAACSSAVTVGAVKGYLMNAFNQLTADIDASEDRIERDRQEIERMQDEIEKLKTQPRPFQMTRCSQCGLGLEVPSIHFFCGHSYHSYCVPNVVEPLCPKCSPEAQAKQVVREQREAQAKNTDEFFKFLRGSPDGFAHVAEYFGRGLFPQQLTPSDMTAAAEPTQPPFAPSPFLSSMMRADMPPPSPSLSSSVGFNPFDNGVPAAAAAGAAAGAAAVATATVPPPARQPLPLSSPSPFATTSNYAAPAPAPPVALPRSPVPARRAPDITTPTPSTVPLNPFAAAAESQPPTNPFASSSGALDGPAARNPFPAATPNGMATVGRSPQWETSDRSKSMTERGRRVVERGDALSSTPPARNTTNPFQPD